MCVRACACVCVRVCVRAIYSRDLPDLAKTMKEHHTSPPPVETLPMRADGRQDSPAQEIRTSVVVKRGAGWGSNTFEQTWNGR